MSRVNDYIVGLRHVGVVTENLAQTVSRLQNIFGIADDDTAGVLIEFVEPGLVEGAG